MKEDKLELPREAVTGLINALQEIMEINHYQQIDNLLLGKTDEVKKEFCELCLEEPGKYSPERLFALKEYLNNLNEDAILGEDN